MRIGTYKMHQLLKSDGRVCVLSPSGSFRAFFPFDYTDPDSLILAGRKAHLWIDSRDESLTGHWRTHVLTTIPHTAYRDAALGLLGRRELEVLRDTWLKLPHVMDIVPNDSAKTLPRYWDVINTMRAVTTLEDGK